MRRLAPVSRLFVRLLTVLSLALIAFGHQPLRLGEAGDVDLAAYVLPDGSLPALCLSGEGGTDGSTGAASSLCSACLLTGSFHLCPPPAASLPDPGESHVLLAGLEAQVGVRPAFSPSAPPTAPPLA